MNNSKKVSKESVVQRKEDHLIISKLGNDLAMMDIQSGAYITFNKTGRIIWELIENPVRIKDIIQNLIDRFGIDEGACTSETINFLSQIEKQDMLRII